MRLFCFIHSRTSFGFSGSDGPNVLSNHDFDSFFLVCNVGCLAVAYSAFFGAGFFRPSVSPVLSKKFFVPCPILSNVDGSFFAADLNAGFFAASFLLSEEEENGLGNDQPSHAAGRTPTNKIIITLAVRIFAVLASMVLALEYEKVLRTSEPDKLTRFPKDGSGSVAKTVPNVQGNFPSMGFSMLRKLRIFRHPRHKFGFLRP